MQHACAWVNPPFPPPDRARISRAEGGAHGGSW